MLFNSIISLNNKSTLSSNEYNNTPTNANDMNSNKTVSYHLSYVVYSRPFLNDF